MKLSGIGGQAVIEGIMMRNKDKYSVAVRKPDQEIEVIVKDCKMTTQKYKWLNYPVIRGIFNFFDSLFTGISVINYSSTFYEDPSEQEKTKIDEIGKNIFKDKFESILMAVTVIISIFLAVGLFMILPFAVSRLLSNYVASKGLLNFFEGIVRVLIFILYLVVISQLSDIKRTFMYHGAEHKCINCIEHGARLTPENVKNSSRYHKRCGTSFLFIVMFISIVLFIFIRVENTAAQIIIRVLLIPLIAGLSYELIMWAGKNDNKFTRALSKPGMWLQRLTTKEPDMDMIEVAIKAVEKVFDWEKFLVEEYYEGSENLVEDIENSERELSISAAQVGKRHRTTRSIVVENKEEDEKELTAEEKYIKAAKEFEATQQGDSLESVYETINELEEAEGNPANHSAGNYESANFTTVTKPLEEVAEDTEASIEDDFVFEEVEEVPAKDSFENVSTNETSETALEDDSFEFEEVSADAEGDLDLAIEDLSEEDDDAGFEFEEVEEIEAKAESEEVEMPAFKTRHRD